MWHAIYDTNSSNFYLLGLSWSKQVYFHRVFLRACHNTVDPEQSAVPQETDYDTNPVLQHVDRLDTKLSGRIIDVGRNVGRNQG